MQQGEEQVKAIFQAEARRIIKPHVNVSPPTLFNTKLEEEELKYFHSLISKRKENATI